MTLDAGDIRNQYRSGKFINLDIVGGNKFGRFKKISPAETYNFIISDGALVNSFGFNIVQNIEGKKSRGIYASSKINRLFLVKDNDVLMFTNENSFQVIGSIDTYAGSVYITENNNNQIAFCDGKDIWVFYFLDNIFKKSDINFSPKYLTFQDTYVITCANNTNQFILSEGFNDASKFDKTDESRVGSIQTDATEIVATERFKNQLYVFGKVITEVWVDTGADLFPYQKIKNNTIEYGCVSADTIGAISDLIVWLGSSSTSKICIIASIGGKAEIISDQNEGIAYFLNNVENPEKSFAFLIEEAGHIYYVLTFIDENKTITFDFKTKEFFTFTDHKLDFFPIKKVVLFNNKYYCISYHDSNLYELSSKYTTQNGKTVPRIRIISTLRERMLDQVMVNNIYIAMSAGLVSDSVTNETLLKTLPQINLSMSLDGGESYGNVNQTAIYNYGDRKRYVNFYNLGGGYEVTFKFQFYGNAQFCILGAVANVGN